MFIAQYDHDPKVINCILRGFAAVNCSQSTRRCIRNLGPYWNYIIVTYSHVRLFGASDPSHTLTKMVKILRLLTDFNYKRVRTMLVNWVASCWNLETSELASNSSFISSSPHSLTETIKLLIYVEHCVRICCSRWPFIGLCCSRLYTGVQLSKSDPSGPIVLDSFVLSRPFDSSPTHLSLSNYRASKIKKGLQALCVVSIIPPLCCQLPGWGHKEAHWSWPTLQ